MEQRHFRSNNAARCVTLDGGQRLKVKFFRWYTFSCLQMPTQHAIRTRDNSCHLKAVPAPSTTNQFFYAFTSFISMGVLKFSS